MFKKKCRCGKTEKSFKMDIGPFFINECCEEAGYDEKGRLKGQEEVEELTETVEPEVEESDPVEEKLEEESPKSLEESSEDFSKMNKKKLQELCKSRDIKFAKSDSRAKLLEKLQ